MNLKTRTSLLLSIGFATACSNPPVQPLMPTPMLYPELGIGPLDHIPAERALKREQHPVLWSIPADYPARLRQTLTRPDIQIRKPAAE